MEKVPYILVVGDEDATAATVGVNARGSERPVRGVAVDAFITTVVAEIASKGSPESRADGPETPGR
jgi:threonyl-tRNA synthetase